MATQKKSLPNSKDIPSEILHLILQDLSSNTLKECQKVSKHWFIVARPFVWKIVEFQTKTQIDKFLNCLKYYTEPKPTKFIKTVVFGNVLDNEKHYIYSQSNITRIAQLLYKLPNVEEIIVHPSMITSFFGLSRVNFLNGFYKKLHKTKLCYIVNRSKGSRKKTIGCCSSIFRNVRISKLLPFMPNGRSSKATLFYDDQEEQTKIIPHSRTVRKLNLTVGQRYWLSPDCLDFIAHYFVGLKEIKISNTLQCSLKPQDAQAYDTFLTFVCSREEYHISTNMDSIFPENLNNSIIMDALNISFQNNFNQLPINCRKTVSKHLQLEFDCKKMKSSLTDNLRQFAFSSRSKIKGFSEIQSEITNNGTHLSRSARIFITYSEDHDITILLRRLLESILSAVTDIDTVTFKFFGGEMQFPMNNFILIGTALSLMTNSLKKVIFHGVDNYEWCRFFQQYDKIASYPSVTHLEIFADNCDRQSIDGFTLTRFTLMFPKLETLEFHHYAGVCNELYHEFGCHLPQIKLNRLVLDVTEVKKKLDCPSLKLQCLNSTYFILRVETNRKMFIYKISFDNLDIVELSSVANITDYKVHYINVIVELKTIKYLEFRLYQNKDDGHHLTNTGVICLNPTHYT